MDTMDSPHFLVFFSLSMMSITNYPANHSGFRVHCTEYPGRFCRDWVIGSSRQFDRCGLGKEQNLSSIQGHTADIRLDIGRWGKHVQSTNYKFLKVGALNTDLQGGSPPVGSIRSMTNSTQGDQG